MSKVTIYKASAGSGKTFTLAVQYIRLLITTDPTQFRNTLAVTFTNKATAEMKDRILEQLYGIGHGLKDSKRYLEALQKSLKKDNITLKDEKIRELCRDALRYILHDYSRFRIETIDSFFQSVLRNLAHELGLNARLQVDLNDKQMLSQAVDNMVDSLGREEDAGVMPWIDQYVKDQLEEDKGWDVRERIKSLARIIFTEHYMNRGDLFREKINNEALLLEYRKQLYKLKDMATDAMTEVVKKFDEAFRYYEDVQHGNAASDVSSGNWMDTYRKKLLEGDFVFDPLTAKRMAGLANPVDLVKKADKNNAELLARLQPLCEAMLECEQDRLQCIKILNTISLSITHINPLRLLDRIEEEVKSISNDSNRFILNKTPQLLSKLIGKSDAPFVFEKMGTLFNNVMIDEFQDTSRLQWNNFKVLLLESQASGGTNLLVGDIKQAIYRFRNGDWRILKDISSELTTNPPQFETLSNNFRSDTRIIGFNNAFFTRAAELLDFENEVGIIRDIYSDVRQFWPDDKEESGYVRISLKKDKNCKDWEDRMLNDMCQQICALHEQGLPYKKMAILVRTKTQTPVIIRYLSQCLPGVQVVSEEGYLLSSSLSLNILIAALKVLQHGKDDPISLRYLIQHYMSDILGINTEIEDYINADAEQVLPAEFITRLNELRQYPMNELCEELFRILHLDRIDGDDAYVLCFFDMLAEYLRTETSDIPSFLQYWEEEMHKQSIPSCEVNGISILTIHKSKGLQYHTVLMPYCDATMEDVRKDSILWCDSKKTPYNALGSLPINGGKSKFEQSEYYDDYHEEQLQRRIEELNILYVGFTRAEHNLFIWGDATGEVLKYSTLMDEVLSTPLPYFEEDKEKGTPGEPHVEFESEQGDGFTTYTMKNAEPVVPDNTADKTSADSTAKNTDNTKSTGNDNSDNNRLTPDFDEQPIAFTSFNRHMDFRQSNDAERYIHHAGEELSDAPGTEGTAPTAEAADAPGAELSYIEQGKLLHEIFSTIHTADELDKALLTYVDKGILKDAKQTDKIRRIFSSALSNPQAKSWFDGTYQVMNECEIVHLDSKGRQISHRTDRVMISPTEVIVVDFKFGRPNPDKYEPQVQNYMELLSQMYPDRTINGYLWYVYRNTIEPVTI